jgi:hypothetical protein
MIIWWSKHVGVILSVLMCDIWINVLLHTSALVGPLHIVNWNARRNIEICLQSTLHCDTRQCNEHEQIPYGTENRYEMKLSAGTTRSLLEWHHSCRYISTTKLCERRPRTSLTTLNMVDNLSTQHLQSFCIWIMENIFTRQCEARKFKQLLYLAWVLDVMK